MRLPTFIAKRYLFAHKRKTVINVISWISLIGLSVSSAALIVVLSVYNGIGSVTQSLFNVFDPELIVKPAQGKTFRTSSIPYDALKEMPQVARCSEMVEENAWITHRHNQVIATLRGVDSNYRELTGLDTLLHEGVYVLHQPALESHTGMVRPPLNYLLTGGTLYHTLGLSSASSQPVAVNIPKRTAAGVGFTLTEAFNTGYAYPAGYFFVQQDVDAQYAVADVDFVRNLLDYAPDEVTALALALHHPRQLARAKKELRALLGDSFEVLDRFEQQPLYYKVYRSERLGIYLILSLIVIIATFNLMASLSLLILDKRHDVSILRSMGMREEEVRQIFFREGLMICTIGVVAGLAVGLLICLLQQWFGIVKMGSAHFVVQAFPVELHAMDFLYSFLLVMGISTLAVFLTTRRLHRRS